MINLSEIYDYVYNEFNIQLNAYKEAQMKRRIESFIYSKTPTRTSYEFIKYCEENPFIKNQFLDLLTINVTEFFRNLDIFLKLKDVFRKSLPKKKFYKIWSSACSNGAEPYSVAMILDSIDITNYKILATDIDLNILEYAKAGVYKEDEIAEVPNYYLIKYFNKRYDNKFEISDAIKRKVILKKHDLILDEYPNDIDLILCRNVVIYLKKEEKMKIYSRFYDSLNYKGVIFIGATENIYDYNQIGFNKLGIFFYQKEVR